MSMEQDKIVELLDDTSRMHTQIKQQSLQHSIRGLQEWQTKRLLSSHADFWHQKRSKPAMQFFIDEIYGSKDFSDRDIEIAGVVPKLVKVLPDKAVAALHEALRLNSLSLALDLRMVAELKNKPVDRDNYYKAYQQCNNLEMREEQILLIEKLGLRLAQVVKIRGVSIILKLARKPAQVAGVENLHHTLEQGFHAFAKLGNVHDFIDPIIQRERTMMKALFDVTSISENPLPHFDQ